MDRASHGSDDTSIEGDNDVAQSTAVVAGGAQPVRHDAGARRAHSPHSHDQPHPYGDPTHASPAPQRRSTSRPAPGRFVLPVDRPGFRMRPPRGHTSARFGRPRVDPRRRRGGARPGAPPIRMVSDAFADLDEPWTQLPATAVPGTAGATTREPPALTAPRPTVSGALVAVAVAVCVLVVWVSVIGFSPAPDTTDKQGWQPPAPDLYQDAAMAVQAPAFDLQACRECAFCHGGGVFLVGNVTHGEDVSLSWRSEDAAHEYSVSTNPCTALKQPPKGPSADASTSPHACSAGSTSVCMCSSEADECWAVGDRATMSVSSPHPSVLIQSFTAPGAACQQTQQGARRRPSHSRAAEAVDGAEVNTPGLEVVPVTQRPVWHSHVIYVCSAPLPAQAQSPPRPRLLYVHAHDTRRVVRNGLASVPPHVAKSCNEACTVCLLWLLPSTLCTRE